MHEFVPRHVPVLLAETMNALAPRAGGHYLDGTLGLGGHSLAILASAANSEICGLDVDAEAMGLARKNLTAYGERVHYFHASYSHFHDCLDELGWSLLDGAMLDLGVSSMQLDEAGRGFSFNSDAPLDMRMDRSGDARKASDLVNGESFAWLRECIATLGEDPQAACIARHIVEARRQKPISTTSELARLVEESYPADWRHKSRRHPATRTFQALRMAVNDELGELRIFFDNILPRLAVGGRLVIIAFHSLEDRMVKMAMRRWARGCLCPAAATACVCGHQPEVRVLFKKPLTAGPDELKRNPRASSAKLRAIEKIWERGN